MVVHSSLQHLCRSIYTYSNASGSYRCGAYHPVSASCFQIQWPDSWHATGITVKELLPIVLAAALWDIHWLGNHFLFHCDNEAVVAVIQNRCVDNQLFSQLLRAVYSFMHLSFFSLFCITYSWHPQHNSGCNFQKQ